LAGVAAKAGDVVKLGHRGAAAALADDLAAALEAALRKQSLITTFNTNMTGRRGLTDRVLGLGIRNCGFKSWSLGKWFFASSFFLFFFPRHVNSLALTHCLLAVNLGFTTVYGGG